MHACLRLFTFSVGDCRIILTAQTPVQVPVNTKSLLGNTILHFAYDAGDKYCILACVEGVKGLYLAQLRVSARVV